MLVAVLLAALLRAGGTAVACVIAGLSAAAASVIGSQIRSVIRRSGAAQLAAAAALPLVGVPVGLAAKQPIGAVLAMAAAWMAVFVSSALVVRGAFARARCSSSRAAWRLDVAAVGLCVLTSVVFGLLGQRSEAIATATAALGCTLIVLERPSVKQMKPLGVALAALALVVALMLGL